MTIAVNWGVKHQTNGVYKTMAMSHTEFSNWMELIDWSTTVLLSLGVIFHNISENLHNLEIGFKNC